MQDSFGSGIRRQQRGFLPRDWHVHDKPSTAQKNKGCTEVHKKNPNFTPLKYSHGTYGYITRDEQYRVNPNHRLTEDQLVTLPMNKKLSKHLAQYACDNAVKKQADRFYQGEIGDFDFDEVVKAINAEDAEDAQKKNQMTAMDRMRNKIEEKAHQKEVNEQAAKDAKRKQRAAELES